MRSLLVALALLAVLPAAARAERRAAQFDGLSHVVHSRRGPVIMHRMVPPFKGVHVYEGRRGQRAN